MKVTLTKAMKEIITVAEMPAVRKVIETMKEDTGLENYASTAANLAAGTFGNEILKVEAEIALNCRVWDEYDEGTENVDVWLEIMAFNAFKETYYKIGTYLSDLWELYDGNKETIKQKMYIRKYELTD